MNAEQKKVFVVLGMPRSGTSAIARSFSALGIELGDHLLAADERNPKGFYEDEDILYKVNRGVSAALDYGWMDSDLDPKQIESSMLLRDYKNYAIGLLCERLAMTKQWGFKDPRTATILPFWKTVFKALNAEDHYVIALRNPISAAHSVQKFAKTDLESGLLMWVKFLVHSIDGTQGKKRVVVSYEHMLQNPLLQLERMQQTLGLVDELNAEAVDLYAHSFLDKNLTHHAFEDADVLSHPAVSVVPFCVKLYSFMLRLARDEMTFDGEEFTQGWQALKNEFEVVQPMFSYIESLNKRKKQLEREMRTMRKSLPWKIMYPIRKIDDALRSIRKKTRRQQRLVTSDEY